MIRRLISPQEALVKAETLCAKTEYAFYEIFKKLKGWGIGDSDSRKIISSLIAHKFIDENRFASAFVRDKYRFGRWGRRKIYYGLLQKRVQDSVIKEALGSIDDEEYFRICYSFLSAKSKTLKVENERERRTKLFKAAISRGYETDIAVKVLNALRDTDDYGSEEVD